FDDEAELEVYDFTCALQQTGRVPADTYAAVLSRWGARGVVELTAVIGYYTMVAQTLNAHQLPLPEGATGLAPAAILVALPPGACDAHFHVFGPHDRFPPAARPVYALPDATPQVAATLRRTLRLTRGV